MRVSYWTLSLGLALGALGLPACLQSAEPATPDLDPAVQRILANHCHSCHSPAAGKPKGGLDLSTNEAIRKGGASGVVAVPGQAKQSLLLQLVQADGEPHMPPRGQLTAAEIATLARWIDRLPPASPGDAPNSGRDHWAFQPVRDPPVPTPADAGRALNPIDAFIRAKLDERGLRPAAPADRATLIRRAYFDLVGLPPAPDEVRAFVDDPSPAAFATVVDRLLASNAYGERWGRHWLDLARYADTGGFHNDLARPHAWRYRDYVIQSFNTDKPFPQFIREQLAGDELPSADTDALIATGFGRNGPSNDDNMGKTPRDLERYRLDELDGVMNTTFVSFLGITLGCARCHDHKYDPISQQDYYRVLAVFNGTARKDLPFPGEGPADPMGKAPARGIMALVETTAKPKPTHVLWRGDVNNPGPVVTPGVPRALSPVGLTVPEPAADARTSGHRLALANWIASPDNPLTYRVLANRIWQHHFGRGLVATPGNFGQNGAAASHPELLDYLARTIVADGGRIKPLHRAILLSATYQQSSRHDPAAAAIDPDNTLLWRQNKRRLEAEAIRDSILVAAGSLNPGMGGPGVKPKIRADLLPASQRNKWPEVATEGPEHWRRSVYIYSKRQLLFPLMELFDAPTTTDVCDRRAASVVPTQALLLMNDDFVAAQARRFAERLQREYGRSPDRAVGAAYQIALGRPPSPGRTRDALAFLEQQTASHAAGGAAQPDTEALTDLCHVLLNCNEFIFLD